MAKVMPQHLGGRKKEMKNMRHQQLLKALVLFAFSLMSFQTSMATTAILLTDEDLITSSRLIVSGEVKSVRFQKSASDQSIYTYVKVDVRQVFKGNLADRHIVLKELGGSADGISVVIPGSPHFEAGKQVLLFLNTAPDGTLHIAHLFMGKYDVTQDAKTGEPKVKRNIDAENLNLLGRQQGEEITNEATLASFTDKIGKVLRTKTKEVAEHESKNRHVPIVAVPSEYVTGSTEIDPAYTTFNPPSRWFQPDSGQPVYYQVNTAYGVPAGDGVTEANQGLAAWTNVTTSSISLYYGGNTYNTKFLYTNGSSDRVNVVIFNDPNGLIDDPVNCGGILARGGFLRNNTTRTVKGVTYYQITEGDVLFNNGFECYYQGDPRNVAEVATHEIGHTIGFDHSTVADATMRAYAYGNGRGAYLGFDDVLGATNVYPTAGNPIDDFRYFVGWQYKDILGREPDRGGWDYWTDQLNQCANTSGCDINAKRIVISAAFFDSGEFKQTNPAFANPGTTTYNQAFVQQCYLSYLRRGYDQGGYDYWLDLLESRRINRPGNITQDYYDVIGAFIFSVEYRQRFGPA